MDKKTFKKSTSKRRLPRRSATKTGIATPSINPQSAIHNPILIYDHRGGRALAPENTIPAYQNSLAIGVDFVDIDVNMTKDEVVVASHNFALNPDITRDADGSWIEQDNEILIKNLTLQELQRYDVGRIKPGTEYAAKFPTQKAFDSTPIPTLQQIIQLVKQHAGNKVGFQIEIKNNPEKPGLTFSAEKMAKAVVEVLQQEQITKRSEVQAGNWQVLQTIQQLNSDISTAYLSKKEFIDRMLNSDPKIAGLWTAGFLLKDFDNSVPKMISELGGKIWGPKRDSITKKDVEEAHHYGLKVVPWTASTPEEIKHLIDLGVDGIISDRPDLLRNIIGRKAARS